MKVKKLIGATSLALGLLAGGIGSVFAADTVINATGSYTAPSTLAASITPTSLSHAPTQGQWDKKYIKITNTGDVNFYPSLKFNNPVGFDTNIDTPDGNSQSIITDISNSNKLYVLVTRAGAKDTVVNTDLSTVNNGFGLDDLNNRKFLVNSQMSSGVTLYPTAGWSNNTSPTMMATGDFVDVGVHVGAGANLKTNVNFSYDVTVTLNQ